MRHSASEALLAQFSLILLLMIFASPGNAAVVQLSYVINASDFQDSNFDPPAGSASQTVSGTYTFTIDTTIVSQDEIIPDLVVGLDITDTNGNTLDYDESNSGVNTDLNLFLNTGRIVIGGNTSGVDFMVGLSNDFRVRFDIDLSDFSVISVVEDLAYVTTVNPFLRGPTTVQLVSAKVIPLPPAIWLFGSALAGLGWLRRKQTA